MEVNVIRSGPFTTVQDAGRRGYRAGGVPLSGAMDPLALRVANLLVGNSEGAAGLEFAVAGPEIEFSHDTLIAVGGAECEGLPNWKPVIVHAGDRIQVGRCLRGARGYLSIAGGIAVTPVLGSRSTYLRGAFGGLDGRTLRNGDVMLIGEDGAVSGRLARFETGPTWRIDARILPAYSPSPTVRVLRGAQANEFGTVFYETEFRVSSQSDRMGLRLEGERLLRATGEELLSAAVAPGTVQVPPDGQPVVLMADAQTIGGYPQVAHVISVDLPVMAQVQPGDHVRFTAVSLHDAHRLAVMRERALAMLREGLAEKLGDGNRRDADRSEL